MFRKALIGASSTLLAVSVSSAFANEVLVSVSQPMEITYRIAHQNTGGKTVFGDLQTIEVDSSTTIPITLDGYEMAGVVPFSVAGHSLPPSANRFAERDQCSLATNKTKATGELSFIFEKNKGTCKTRGGIFG